MLARSLTAALQGIHGSLVTVEAEVGLGLPGLTIVGRATGAVAEARERVRAAMAHCGHELRPRKQVVNLAPADVRKDSPGIDLAVAVALLASHEIVPAAALQDLVLWGELALDGRVRPAAGALVVADTAWRHGAKRLAVAPEAADEAALISGLEVVAVAELSQLVAALRGDRALPRHVRAATPAADGRARGPDLADVRGLPVARLALEVMIAGGHNLLLHGPPGVGKTMLARRAGALLPALDEAAALEVTKVHGVARGVAARELVRRAPVRMPHHTVSVAGLLGGGTPIRPGEVSLAHRGLLFLDELLEFPRACLEGLREPLEDGEVTIVRASGVVRLPARFQLMAAMNPCPCGYLGHPERACVDPPTAVARYRRRLSGPLLDRIDLVVPVQPVGAELFDEPTAPESSAEVAARIEAARARQRERLADSGWHANAQIAAEAGAIETLCPLRPAARTLLRDVVRTRRLSPRAQHRLRRVAQTLADLAVVTGQGRGDIDELELAQAAALRCLPEG
ncbi:MAG: YifB family Mg chelatase-like AAA ATPase [Nannocystaceae bacterium]